MYLYIQEVNEKSMWEQFLGECSEKTFLHSWNWGEFSKAIGSSGGKRVNCFTREPRDGREDVPRKGDLRAQGKVWRLGLFEEKELVGVAQVIKVDAKRGTFLLVPHGPVLPKASTFEEASMDKSASKPIAKYEIINVLLKRLKKIAKEEKAGFIRINPIWSRMEEGESMFGKFGFREAPMITHPEATWKLDITPSEKELLKQMRKTTRYLIRQTLKNPDIEVSLSDERKDVKIFSEFHKEVSGRQNFVPFSREYLEKEFDAFHQDNQALLVFGKYKGELAAAAFVIFWSGIGFYHHAASYPQYNRFAIPYRVQWEAIREAKRRECKLYDFWGYVNPNMQPHHPWAGPTLFKMGFGGKAYEYIRAQDLPLSWRYWPSAIFEKIRRIHRHL